MVGLCGWYYHPRYSLHVLLREFRGDFTVLIRHIGLHAHGPSTVVGPSALLIGWQTFQYLLHFSVVSARASLSRHLAKVIPPRGGPVFLRYDSTAVLGDHRCECHEMFNFMGVVGRDALFNLDVPRVNSCNLLEMTFACVDRCSRIQFITAFFVCIGSEITIIVNMSEPFVCKSVQCCNYL